MIAKKLIKYNLLLTSILFSLHIAAQDSVLLMKQAANLELKFDEAGALEKYKQVVAGDSLNIKALVKSAGLSNSIGSREKNINTKTTYFQQADTFARKAYAADTQNTDACYAVALAAQKLNELEPDNKTLVYNFKRIKIYTDRALAADSNNAKANHLLGIWHFKLISEGLLKKQSIKNFYNAIPDTQVDSAAYYMEKARVIEPYFAADYLDLANVYIFDHQPAKALEVLNKLVKLPNRTYDDAAIKKAGNEMLKQLQ